MFGILKLCIDTSVETYWNKVVRELISITCDWTMRLFWSPIYWTLKQQSAGLMFWSCLIFYEMSNWLPNIGTVSLAGKHLLTHLCCKLLCYRIILMEGIPMYARSKFMDLDRASSTYLCTIFCSPVSDYKYTNWTPPPPPLFFFSNAQFRNPFPHQPFQFTSREFIMYSSVRWEIWPCQQRRRIVKLSQEERWSM